MPQIQDPPLHRGYNVEFLKRVSRLTNLQAQTQAHRENKYHLLRLEPGLRVLDAGCGPGSDTIPLAQLVGSSGQVVGIDQDAEMIAAADKQAQAAAVSAWVTHQVQDVSALPFVAQYFDRCHSERLFIHLIDPQPSLTEIVRVTRPGGWIVISEPDFASVSTDTSAVDVERRLTRFKADSLANGYVARQLYRLFRHSGLADVAVLVEPVWLTDWATARYLNRADEVEELALAAGIVTPTELAAYNAEAEAQDAAGEFFAHFSMITIAGRKV